MYLYRYSPNLAMRNMAFIFGGYMKFNQNVTLKVKNNEGAIAYGMGSKPLLVTQVLTTFFNENKFYGDTSSSLVKNATSLAATDPKFVSNLARYARKELHLRSVSHVLTCIVAHEVESKPYIHVTVDDVVERADDILEILSCYLNMYGKPIPNGLKKALASQMRSSKFGMYDYSKYNGGNKQVKFKDVLKLTHAVPSTVYCASIFQKIMNDDLPIAKRWETELSANGNNKETWENLIEENRLGYMAALRNLRNIINADPGNIEKVFKKLENKKEVLKSKQLPFRFLSAYKEVPKSSRVLDVLENAIEYSCENLPKLKGRTVIAYDISGSMCCLVGNKSSVLCADISALLAVLASRMCENYIVYSFNNTLHNVTYSKRNGILETAQSLSECNGGTNMALPLQEMLDKNIYADRLIIISDNEINRMYSGYSRGYKCVCQSLADEYRKKINKDLWVHAIDLQGYGTQQFIGKNTNIIAGWSERVLEFIDLAEKGISTQVELIEKYGG